MHRPSGWRKHRKIDVEQSPAEESRVTQELSDDAESVRDDQRSSAPPAEIKSRTRPRCGSRMVSQITARNGARPASHTESVNG